MENKKSAKVLKLLAFILKSAQGPRERGRAKKYDSVVIEEKSFIVDDDDDKNTELYITKVYTCK